MCKIKEHLDFTALKNALKIIKKHNNCYMGYADECGCGLLHGFFYQCDLHHKQLLIMADLLWKDANNEGILVEELFGIKLVK